MKILPVNFLYNYPKINNVSNLNFALTPANTVRDTFVLSFKGDVEDQTQKPMDIDIDKLKTIGDIHCPVCGTKMLSQQKLEELYERTKTIDNTPDFMKLLSDYKDYIPSNMKTILPSPEEYDSCANLSMTDFVFNRRNVAYNRYKRRLNYASANLKQYSETVPENFKEKFLKASDDVLKVRDFPEYKNIIFDLVFDDDFPHQDRARISRNLLPSVRSASMYLALFTLPIDKMTPNDLAITLVNRVFHHSLITSTPVQIHPYFDNLKNNTIALCAKCNHHSGAFSFVDFNMVKNSRLPYLKDNISNYLSDVAKLMGRGDIEKNNLYFSDVCFYIGKLSNSRITYDANAISRLKNLMHLSSRREDFAPIDQVEVDIPCAGCGSTLLPHAVRRNIRNDLQLAKNPKEYLGVLNKYEKYIGAYSIDLYKIFKSILEKNPNISNEEFLPIFQEKADNLAQRQLNNALITFKKNKEYFMNNGTDFQKDIITKFDAALFNYILSGKFSDMRMDRLMETVTYGIDLNALGFPKAIYVALDDIRRLVIINEMSKPSELDAACDKNPVETIVFNIFKADVATADHLVSAVKGGSRTKDNLIGLCKACNFLKSEKGVKAWFAENFAARKNFPRQLEVIDKMAKDKLIDGYDTWASTIAETIYEKTRGKCDFRHMFPKE